METNAYFENIREHLLEELRSAKRGITAAVAWFTDPAIYELLCEKAVEGIPIRLLLIGDEINRGAGALDFARLREAGGEVFFVAESGRDGGRMHNKFCVIDDSTVVTGSYNWSRRAQRNRENITVISGDTLFAGQFLAAFDAILAAHGLKSALSQAAAVDPALILRRLELVRNLVLLEETDQIVGHAVKLRAVAGDDELESVVSLLEGEQYGAAVTAIGKYIARRQAIAEYRDPEIDALRLELKSLEIQVTALDDEKAELERLIHEFVVRQNQEIGELLTEYLRLKRERLARERATDPESEAAYEEADRDYEEYRREYEAVKDEHLPELDTGQKAELKKLFRKASRLCHPDKVADRDKEEAHDMFVALNEANQGHDLARIREILSALQEGRTFADKSESISGKQRLESEVQNLRRRMEQVTAAIRELRESEIYETIESIEEWDSYFEAKCEMLREEIERMTAKEISDE